jgi:sugar phosphate isomerase/epimerase
MPPEEAVQVMRTQLKLARRLGFKIMRPITGAMPTTGDLVGGAPKWLEEVLPYAAENDIRIVFELHAPMPWTGPFVDSYLDIIERTKTKHLGFNPDLGAYAKRLPRVILDRWRRNGAQEKVVRYLEQAFLDGVNPRDRMAQVQKMSPNPADTQLAFWTFPMGPVTNRAEDLQAIMPYIFNVHGKFYEITDDFKEYSIPYEPIFRVLAEGGYSGYVNSEYEGQIHTQDIKEMDSCEQVRKHHVMMRRLMGEI